jgi:hypothetical protein
MPRLTHAQPRSWGQAGPPAHDMAFVHIVLWYRAVALLAGAPVLGIDCEWQPALRADESQSAAPVAILQVAACATTTLCHHHM